MEEEAHTLYNSTGILVFNDEGKLYTNQTGGVCCHHPEARGNFYPVDLPEEISDMLYGYLGEEDFININHKLGKYGLWFRLDGTGEEGWWGVKVMGGDGVLIHPNSD